MNDDQLKHYGVLGMRWGVRRSETGAKEGRVTVKERVGSLKRERNWKKVLNKTDEMSNEDINAVNKRIGLENNLKKLVKTSNMAKKSDKADYIRRGDLSDDDLESKVTRLRIKDNLSKSINEASKEQREFGEKIINASSELALTYAKTQQLTGNQIYNIVTNPNKDAKKNLSNYAAKELYDSLTK